MRPTRLLRTVFERLRPSGNLNDRVVKSGLWMLSQKSVGRALQLVMLVILARLIGPEEIGLVGIALLALSAMRGLTNIGLNEALIQRKAENVDEYLDTTWVLETGRGLLICLALVGSAPFLASLFGSPRAEPLLRVIAVSPLLLGLRNPGVVYFQKNLEFHKQFFYRVSGDIFQLVVAVGYALVWPTAWAFALGFVAADAFRLAVSYLIHDYRPWPAFDREIAAELINFGKWITGSSILFFLYSEGDDAFVGWFISPAALALYQYGYRFSNAPATELSSIVSSVMFPAYSKVQDDTAALRDSFLKTIRLTALVAFPMAFGIAAVTPTFVRAFLGSEWIGMVTAMQILTVYGLLRSIGKSFGAVWKAIDRPDIIAKLSALRVSLLAVGIYPATAAWGIEGTALLVTGVFLFPMMPIDIYIVVRSVETTYTALLSEMLYPLVASAVMAAGVWYVHLSLSIHPMAKFAVLVAVGFVLYCAVALAFERQFDWGITDNFRTIVSALRV